MKDKLKAFAIHLLVSIMFALVSVGIIYFIWYPDPLYKATGVTHIFLLMLGIDIILGPLLTFVVYKKGKKTLKFDLAVIIVLQVSALLYGLFQMYDGRPVWVVYNVDRFDLVRINEIDTRKISEAGDEYKVASSVGVQYIASVIPMSDTEQKNQILIDEVTLGVAPSQRPELYRPLSDVNEQIVRRSQKLESLEAYNPPEVVKQILSKYPQADSFVPLKANAVDMTVLIDKKAKEKVVAIVDLRPWKLTKSKNGEE